MDSLWMAALGRQLGRDGSVLVRAYPAAVLKTIRGNLVRYFIPADSGWPFDGAECPQSAGALGLTQSL